MENIDFERLRRDLKEYFGTAMFNGFPQAMMEMMEVEKASDETLINIANRWGFNLNNYVISRGR